MLAEMNLAKMHTQRLTPKFARKFTTEFVLFPEAIAKKQSSRGMLNSSLSSEWSNVLHQIYIYIYIYKMLQETDLIRVTDSRLCNSPPYPIFCLMKSLERRF